MVSEHFLFVEVLVLCFKNSEGDPVHLLVEAHVSAVDQPVRILGVKLRRKTRYGSSFGIARGNIGK